MPIVSIIVPNYNHARFLTKRIESILRQTFQDFELILLDDCSTDGSRSILSKYAANPRVRVEFNDTNSGSPFRQWNRGIRLASGKYIWMAESDDYADERLLERLVPALEADARIAFAYCRSWHVSDDGQLDGFEDTRWNLSKSDRWATNFCVKGTDECRSYFPLSNPVQNASAVIFRKDLYESVGGADESFRICGDWKLWAAMALAGKIAYLKEPLNYFRSHNASVRNTGEQESRGIAEPLRVLRWLLTQVAPATPVLEEMRRRQAWRWVPFLMSTHVPFDEKRLILRDVRAIDPHPIRSALSPALATFQRKFMRHWRYLSSKLLPSLDA
jgi:glycosyltransferase involved in cell wall biosynthesis